MRVAFAFNFGLYRTFIDAGREDVYIAEGYVPLLRALRRHPRIKANLFIEGLSALRMKTSAELVRLVRGGLADGQFELGTYTYNHPVLTLLPFEDCRRQWELGRKIDREVWGAEPCGAMMPEAAWDPSNVEIFRDIGVHWVLLGSRLYREDFPDESPAAARTGFRLQGTNGTRVYAVCQDSDDFGDGPPFYVCGAVVQGAEQNVREFRARLDHFRPTGGDAMLLAAKNDAEFVYEEALANRYGRGWQRTGFSTRLGESIPEQSAAAERQLDAALAGYEETPGVAFVTLSEYFAQCPPQREILLRASAKGYREWLEGSEKFGELLHEAQTEIRIARAAVQLGRTMGLDVRDAETEIEAAWQAVLWAETSTGRRACAHAAGKASRIVWAMDKALEATRRARAAVGKIRR